MPARIILIRHAETTANVEQRWQGATDTRFSERGHQQLARVASRLAGEPIDRVVASDLGRAEQTAAALGGPFTTDPRLREPNVGDWEGRTFDEIRAAYPAELDDLLLGRDVQLGGGERLSDVGLRMRAVFDELARSLGEQGTGVLVSHGMALLTLVTNLLDTSFPARLHLMANTAITEFSVGPFGPQLVRYNDTSHLAHPPRFRGADTNVFLVRHGETQANIEGRWQGHGDWPLNDRGIEQAQALARILDPVDAVIASPLMRTRSTAAELATTNGHVVEVDERLKEIGFGTWENLTRSEIEAVDPGGLQRLIDGEDVNHGGSGETFATVQQRMAEAIDTIVDMYPGGVVGVVSHGGASRAYLTKLLGIGFAERNRVRTLDNTAYAHLTFGARGALIGTWNIAPHLRAAEIGDD